MYRFALALLPCLLGLFNQPANADEPLGHDAVSVYCGENPNGEFACVENRAADATQARSAARRACTLNFLNCQESLPPTRHMCISGFANDALHKVFVVGSSSDSLATSSAQSQCSFANVSLAQRCHELFTICPQNLEIADAPAPAPPVITLPVPVTRTQSPAATATPDSSLIDFNAIRTGISFGVGIVIALLIYAKRAAIANVIIHGNLPPKIPVYAEDIQVLFKRTQRINWYGRVVFGIIARLSMDHKQFSLVRKYWLGRVIAFDSLRRQRQNQLARMHLQLAASLKPEQSDKKPSSWLWIAIKYYLFLFFYLIRSLISFLIGFLFIRITIAKLIRGTLIESTDLPLVFQAKEAVEQTAQYLREYLITAETFDGREELYEPK